MSTTTDHLTTLAALAHLGLPIVTNPQRFTVTPSVMLAMNEVEVALLRLQIAVMSQQLEGAPVASPLWKHPDMDNAGRDLT